MKGRSGDNELAEALQAYIAWLGRPAGAAPALPEGIGRLARVSVTAGPSSAFVEELSARLASSRSTSAAPVAASRKSPPRYRLAAMAAAAAVVAAIGVAVMTWPGGEGTRPASAAAIVADAQRATDALSAQSPTDFTLTVRHTMWASILGADGVSRDRILHRVELRRWVQQPDRWRTELWFISFDESGNIDNEERIQVLVGDGTTFSTYNRGAVEQRPQAGDESINTSITLGTVSDAIGGPSLDAVLTSAAECHAPELLGTEDVDGRSAYVIDLRENRCPPVAEPDVHRYEPVRIWIDSQSSLALKWLSKSTSTNTWVTSEIVGLNLSPAFDAGVFDFDPPSP